MFVQSRSVLLIAPRDQALEHRCAFLATHGFVCVSEPDPSKALDLVKTVRPDIVVADFRTPRLDGLQALDDIAISYPETIIILETSHSVMVGIDRTMHELVMPEDPHEAFSEHALVHNIRKAITLKAVLGRRGESDSKEEEFAPAISRTCSPASSTKVPALGPLIGASSGMQQVFERIRRAAQTDASVLLDGETGTGKELVAQTIHSLSARSKGPFVAVDALPDTLIESELFGHERGSFTGAYYSTRGLIREADGGTLFLDEISGMSLLLQARLLRVLQERRLRPLGSTKVVDLRFRLISATNKDLSEAIARGEFREDLFYRLCVVRITLPPLRERPGDVPLLANHFLRHYGGLYGKNIQGFSDEAVALLERYAWPGNVRELQHVIESLVVLADKPVIPPYQLPESILSYMPKLELSKSFKDSKQTLIHSFEYTYLTQLIKKHHGQLAEAAKEAGVDRKTIERLLRKHRIDESVFSPKRKAGRLYRLPSAPAGTLPATPNKEDVGQP